MVCLQIQDIQNMFNMLNELKQNEWKLENLHANNVVTKKIIKKPLKPNTNTTNSNTSVSIKSNTNKPSSNISQIDTARQAARSRLLEAKKNAALIKQREAAGLDEFSTNSDVCVLSSK